MRIKGYNSLKLSLEYHLGLCNVPANTKKFLITHFYFLLYTTIPGVFINTFFYRQDGRLSTVSIYNAIVAFGLALVMQVSSKISLKKSPVFIIRIGVVLFNVFYILLLLLQNQAVKYMPLLGVVNAIANGFYWQGYNELIKLCTSENIFDRIVSIVGLSNAAITLLVPIISGCLITYIGGYLGYTIIFCISFLFSIYTTYLSTQIGNIKIAGASNLAGVYRNVFTNKISFKVYMAEFFRGIKFTAFPLLLTIIFFKFITNESILGINNMLCGLTSMVSYFIAGKIINQKNRSKSLLLATVVSLLCSLPMFFIINSAYVFILAIINTCAASYIDNPATAIFYYAHDKLKDGINFPQVMASREVFFASGKVVGLILIIVSSNNLFQLAVAAFILNISTFFSWLFFHSAEHNMASKATDQ